MVIAARNDGYRNSNFHRECPAVRDLIIEAGITDIATVRRLFQAYADSLPFSLEFQNFAAELAGLPAPYAPPAGSLLLARRDGVALGVVALKPLAKGIAELKRLYVVPEARGAGVGK